MSLASQPKNNLKKAIAKTIAFFDLFDYPLTPLEIWQYLSIQCSFGDLLNTLNQLNFLASQDGFYFLKGREALVKIRRQRYNYTEQKFKKALRASRIFSFIPWIKMIAVANIIGRHNLRRQSDIDFFIVVQEGKIWITRFLLVLITAMLLWRPTDKKQENKICLSFFVSDHKLDLADFFLGNVSLDIYFIYWLAGLVPIFGSKKFYYHFISQNNYIKKYLPNWQPIDIVDSRFNFTPQRRFLNLAFNFFLWPFEELIKFISLKFMNPKLKKLSNKDTRVIVSDAVLKLHVNDQREEYFKKWQQKITHLNKYF